MRALRLILFIALEIIAGLIAFLFGLGIVAGLYTYLQAPVPWWVGILIGIAMIFPLSAFHNLLSNKLFG